MIMVDITVFYSFCYGGRLLFIRVLTFVIVICLAPLILILASKVINYLKKMGLLFMGRMQIIIDCCLFNLCVLRSQLRRSFNTTDADELKGSLLSVVRFLCVSIDTFVRNVILFYL